MSGLISEEIRPVKGFLGDANGGAETVRVDLSKCDSLQFEVQLAAGVATDCALNLRQHDAASAGNSADLVSTLPHYVKTDAEASFARVDANVAAVETLDTDAGTVLVEVYKEDLEEGYRYVSLQVADPGAARIVSVTANLKTKLKPAYQVEL